jgi:CheY-like chemotaxis protein
VTTPRILVVDDDPRVGADLRKLLGPLGYDVHLAEGGGEALLASATAAVLQVRPHVVVLDVRFLEHFHDGDRKGLDFLKSGLIGCASRVVYSGHLETLQAMREAIEGADAVVGKSEAPRVLLTAIQNEARRKCGHQSRFRVTWPDAWTPDRVVQTLLAGKPDVPGSLAIDVFCGVFAERESVQLAPLDSPISAPPARARSRSVIFEARPEGLQPVLVKLAPGSRIREEVGAYQTYVSGRLGGHFRPSLQSHCVFWEIGAIRYDLLGSSATIHTLASHYVNCVESRTVVTPLTHFFSQVWSMNYREARSSSLPSLFDAYDRLMRLTTRLGAMVTHCDDQLHFPEIGRRFDHPARWAMTHRQHSEMAGRRDVVVHGDLHANNLLTDGTHVWPVDFERTGYGPCFADHVELEQDIVTRLSLSGDGDIRDFYDLARAVVAPRSLGESVNVERAPGRPDGLSKTCAIVDEIRSAALALAGADEIRDYYWGLLFNAIVGASVVGESTHQGRRCLLLASLICQRLTESIARV